MSTNMVTFSSNNFDNNTPHLFKNLWAFQDFVDVTLATVDDQQIKANKVILSSGSLLFRNIFVKNTHKNPLLYLKDIRYSDLEMVLQFIYTGRCDVEQSKLEDFLSVGKYLGVIGLQEYETKSEKGIVDNLSKVIEDDSEDDARTEYEDKYEIPRKILIDTTNVCTNGREQEKVEFACNDCDTVYKTGFELKGHVQAVYEGLISECNQCDYEATPVDLDGILESKDLTYVEWWFNRFFWDNHRVVSDLEADLDRQKEDVMKKGEITQLTEYIDSGKEETVVTEKVEVPEIRFASTDIRYRKQQVPVDSGKVKKYKMKKRNVK